MPIFASNRLSDAATPVLGTLASVFCASRKLNRRDAEKIAISFWPLAKSQELKAKSDFHGRRFGAEGGATSDMLSKIKEGSSGCPLLPACCLSPEASDQVGISCRRSPSFPSSLQTACQMPQLPFWERWHLLFCVSRKLNRRDGEKTAISFWPLAKSQELNAKSDFHGRRFGAEGGITSDMPSKIKEGSSGCPLLPSCCLSPEASDQVGVSCRRSATLRRRPRLKRRRPMVPVSALPHLQLSRSR
jgi:hypothetical protein